MVDFILSRTPRNAEKARVTKWKKSRPQWDSMFQYLDPMPYVLQIIALLGIYWERFEVIFIHVQTSYTCISSQCKSSMCIIVNYIVFIANYLHCWIRKKQKQNKTKKTLMLYYCRLDLTIRKTSFYGYIEDLW